MIFAPRFEALVLVHAYYLRKQQTTPAQQKARRSGLVGALQPR
jgi:hypothetical protein